MLNVYEEMAETSRRQILAELRTGPKTVTDIVAATGLKQPNVSDHLARMKMRDIVRCGKCGRQAYYTLATPEIEAIVHAAFAPNSPCAKFKRCDLIKRYARAAVDGDETVCNQILDEAFRARMPMLDIYQDILAPAMGKVGLWYKEGFINEWQEHLASCLTEQMMARTVQVTGPVRRHNRTAMLGCGPNSWHVIGLRMLGDYLRYCGWKTMYLGANVPASSFVSAVKQQSPDTVLISCGSSECWEGTLDLIRKLDELRQDGATFSIVAGGNQVELEPKSFLAAGADFTATDLRHFATTLLPELEQPRTAVRTLVAR